MCGIAAVLGRSDPTLLDAMIAAQHHRGPDAAGVFRTSSGAAQLGHNRLSIIDLSAAANQPLHSADGTLAIVFNGEIYNYLELRAELRDYPFRTNSDTEVLLAAYAKWGEQCLDRLLGMFAFVIWDANRNRAFAARDRFGVKPLYYSHAADGSLLIASEIKALHAAGVPRDPDPGTWATYLTYGLYDHSPRTFWNDVTSLPAGHYMVWENGQLHRTCWYRLSERIRGRDETRPIDDVTEEYLALLRDTVRLRFRSDVPVGINLSGGLDSSLLLSLVQMVQGEDSDVQAFTFVTNDARYDELPWVSAMLAQTRHPSVACELNASDVPDLAASVQASQDEPFGGIPTLAYANLFARARERGVIVLLDGQGLDEQWAGYDYYATARRDHAWVVQGTRESPVRPGCLVAEFRALATPLQCRWDSGDAVRDLQLRDAIATKLPRALRFNDRVSMRSSTELREPFLDHRLFELAISQPVDRRVSASETKVLLRRIARTIAPREVTDAPKRPVQTPQREWLRQELGAWATERIEHALTVAGGCWLDADMVRQEWDQFRRGAGDNSFFVWQWISLGMLL
jgi:asparagine synthase (glutamine-hydrolysing)